MSKAEELVDKKELKKADLMAAKWALMTEQLTAVMMGALLVVWMVSKKVVKTALNLVGWMVSLLERMLVW